MQGRRFLPPILLGDTVAVGFRVGRRAWLAEGKNFLTAYHKLHEQVVG